MNDDEQRQHLEDAAKQSLDVFEKISANALSLLSSGGGASLKALASANAFTMQQTAKTLGNIARAQHEASEKLAREPSIARVIAEDEEGNLETFFISRAAAPAPFLKGVSFASYRSPAGRLASLPPGESLNLRRPKSNVVFEVVERALFHPEQLPQGWDSRDTLFQTEAFGPVTVESLRRLFDEAADAGKIEDALDVLLREEEALNSIVDKRRKALLKKMGLRDQPILDQFQDKIFRMPINSRAILLGPPGSGKTTTLIKRLGQKVDLEIIKENEPDEYALITRMSGGGEPHTNSWLMLTPTELLRTYVKEAFGRENIAAPNERVRTWVAHRRDLARDAFPILRTGDGGGPFIMREDEATLLPEAVSGTQDWYTDFDDWQNQRFWSEFVDAADQLTGDADPAIAALGSRLVKAVASARSEPVAQGLFRLVALIAGVRSLLSESRDRSDKTLRKSLNLQVNSDKEFLRNLGHHIESLGEPAGDDADDEDSDSDEDDAPRNQQPLMRIANIYLSTLRSQARAAANGRKPRGRTAAILAWLGERVLPETDIEPVGRELLLQRALLRFSNPVRQYLRGIPRRYRSFRQVRREEQRWYQAAKAGPHVHGLEVDLMLLVGLSLTKSMVRDVRLRNLGEDPGLAALDRSAGLLRNQVLVDEATDFSPVQLACMAALAHPAADSFFACGDFNQRITSWGANSVSQLRWVLPDIKVEKIAIAYRQTRQLLEFARAIAAISGEEPVLAKLPDHVDNEGNAPALATGLHDQSKLVRWLAARILEIEAAVQPNPLPTIAVLVNNRELGKPVAETLDRELEARNLRAIDCTDGRTISEANEVGIFDVNDIKGLEFEAVFFLAIDRLADEQDLYARFLYVGATRAATYLGITCEGDLPESLTLLENMFIESWS
ncbi:ATP-binding domain-containing protein [Erythrobacter crassostreae]|uniref:ATP-binding domain-containing protein n=1 Tax=Erythrobacter crassostreae TaxID=2828328 RepID=A0A9X1JN42_9SPHN|nr:ATP-binding domain-containing protein [Erythrobacter crassostrea]MBV7259358.1 ATP-binding domain-containing protein [Erythrobacter crassostrea]